MESIRWLLAVAGVEVSAKTLLNFFSFKFWLNRDEMIAFAVRGSFSDHQGAIPETDRWYVLLCHIVCSL